MCWQPGRLLHRFLSVPSTSAAGGQAERHLRHGSAPPSRSLGLQLPCRPEQRMPPLCPCPSSLCPFPSRSLTGAARGPATGSSGGLGTRRSQESAAPRCSSSPSVGVCVPWRGKAGDGAPGVGCSAPPVRSWRRLLPAADFRPSPVLCCRGKRRGLLPPLPFNPGSRGPTLLLRSLRLFRSGCAAPARSVPRTPGSAGRGRDSPRPLAPGHGCGVGRGRAVTRGVLCRRRQSLVAARSGG